MKNNVHRFEQAIMITLSNKKEKIATPNLGVAIFVVHSQKSRVM
ncbi:hypothetical protein [Candidatus Enterococcus courvalinii]|nr:hypothetical protein [Enterococcus sp. MSG2901]